MSNVIATFEKVSYQQWINDQCALHMLNDAALTDEGFSQQLRTTYDNIKLPIRATNGSAGYDFYLPNITSFDRAIPVVVPTGIRVKIEPGWMLALFPRSSLGFKYGMNLKNTVGIIDSDYYNAANEGHIMAKIGADTDFTCKDGERFMQGVFIPYGLAANDAPMEGERVGGFGSTGS